MRTLAIFVLGCGLIAVALGGMAADPPAAATAPATRQPELPRLPETEVLGGGAPGGPATPGPAAPAAPGEGGSVVEGTIFSSPPATGYDAPSSTTGTLIDVPNLEVPASVDVVTQPVLVDQQAVRIDDVLRDVAGAVKVGDDLRPDDFFLRGFQVTSRDYRKDGFLDPTYTPRDFANVERVEVLKGPASILYGAGQPSGVVNLITKNPLDQAFSEAGLQVGSFGMTRYTVDSTGPISSDKSVLYRINAAYEHDDSFRDYGYLERTFVAPAASWVVDSDTLITWKGEFLNDNRRYDTGVAAINGQLGVMPISRFLGEPSDYLKSQDYRQSLVMKHRIDDNWAWDIGGYSLFYGGPSSATYPAAYVGPTPLGPETFVRTRQDVGPWKENYQSFIANLAGEFAALGMEHKVVLGTEQGWFQSNQFTAAQSSPQNPATPLPLDAVNPLYDNTFFTGLPNPQYASVYTSSYYSDRHGVYFQDLASLDEHWKVLAGVRYDHVNTIFERTLLAAPPVGFGPVRTDQTFDVGTPRVGLIYEALPDALSYYATYTESFDPPGGGSRATPDPLQSEFGEIWEGGVKAKLLDNLTVTAAGFYITKQNVIQDRFDFTTFTFVTTQIGQQRSQGCEIEALGQLTDRWSVIGNWAYTDTRLTDPGQPDDGQRAVNVPYNTANLWTRYNFVQEPRRTFGAALGVVYVGDRLGDPNDPTFRLPDYTRWDAGVYYHRNRFDLSVYLENVFDTTYYTGSLSSLAVYPGAPFTTRAQVAYRF